MSIYSSWMSFVHLYFDEELDWTMRERRRGNVGRERVMFTLPPEVVAEAKKFADAFHDGNKSGFVAAAIRSYVEHLRKSRHTSRMRASYSKAAREARASVGEWESVASESWEKLDSIESKGRRRAK